MPQDEARIHYSMYVLQRMKDRRIQIHSLTWKEEEQAWEARWCRGDVCYTRMIYIVPFDLAAEEFHASVEYQARTGY